MASQQYITIDDIENTSLRKFSDEDKQRAVDATNDFYEAHVVSHNLKITDIHFPIQLFVKQALVAYCEMNMARTRITGSNVTNGQPGKYDVIYSLSKDFYLTAINRVNKGLITGIADKSSSTFTFIDVEQGV